MAAQKPFLTIDCETDPFKVGRVPLPFVWGLYDGQTEQYNEFDDVASLIAALENREVIIYAHNGGKFDYHYLREYINSDQAVMVISGRLSRFHIGVCEFRDSINILVNPLRVFAKEEIDYKLMEPDVRQKHMTEIRKYLRSDCVNLWNTIHSYNELYGRTLTQAGAAMKYWRKNYPTDFVKQTATQSAVYRDFYYGGRVQCFKKGYRKAKFSVVDINSAYPRAMLEQHPISPEGVLESVLPKGDRFLNCMIRLRAVSRGAFPLRAADGLYFPHDERTVREYFVTGWELRAAMEHNAVRIVQLIEIHRFVKTINFADYVEHFYSERKRAKAIGDRALDTFAKLFLNSLYGKFAADPEKYAEYMIASDDTLLHWVHRGWERIGDWGTRHLVSQPLPEVKHNYYNVATAASITGYVRAMLFDALSRVYDPIYCDTDSIAARDVSGLELGPELGQWKLEAECDQYAIGGKKLYAFRKTDKWLASERTKNENAPQFKTASKGVRLTPEQIIDVARGKEIIYEPDVPTYSIHSAAPHFVNRVVKSTYKDVSTLPT